MVTSGPYVRGEAVVPTCNLLETIHNKWLQASGNRMVDLYSAKVPSDKADVVLVLSWEAPSLH